MSESVTSIVRGPAGQLGFGNVRFTPADEVGVTQHVNLVTDEIKTSDGWLRAVMGDLSKYSVLSCPPIDGRHRERAAAKAATPPPELPPITAIAKLAIQPGESLVAFVDSQISHEQADHLKRYVQQQLDTDAPVLVLGDGVTLGILSAQAAEMVECASTAKTLPGALSEASGGHRLGGWGAVE